MASVTEIFICYAREDDELRLGLEKQLRALQRQGLISALWHNHDINAGAEWEPEIDSHLNTAQIILFLLSSDFLASDYYYDNIVKRAMERHERGEACIIPILLRPVHWQNTQLGKIRALPKNGKSIIDRSWHSLDEALFEVTDDLRLTIKHLHADQQQKPQSTIDSLMPISEGSHALSLRNPEEFALVRTLVDHLGPVASVIFSTNGEILISDSWDNNIKLWDVPTGRVVCTLVGHAGPIYSIVPVGTTDIVSSGGEDGVIRVWDTLTEQVMYTMTGHSGAVSSIAFDYNTGRLSSGSDDSTIKIWDLRVKQLQRTLVGHTEPVSSVAFSPDGWIVASGSHDGSIRLWNIDGSERGLLIGHAGPVSSVAFSPDGRTLISGSHDGTVKIWDLRIKQLLGTLIGHAGPVSSVAFSPDGRRVASGGHDKSIKIWQLPKGQLLTTLLGHHEAVLSVAFHPSGNIIASGSLDKTIKFWQERTTKIPTMDALDSSKAVYIPPMYNRPNEQVCPSCEKRVFLGDCAIVSVVTGKVLKKAPNELERVFARLKPLEKLTDPLYVAAQACRLCPYCKHILPSDIS